MPVVLGIKLAAGGDEGERASGRSAGKTSWEMPRSTPAATRVRRDRARLPDDSAMGVSQRKRPSAKDRTADPAAPRRPPPPPGPRHLRQPGLRVPLVLAAVRRQLRRSEIRASLLKPRPISSLSSAQHPPASSPSHAERELRRATSLCVRSLPFTPSSAPSRPTGVPCSPNTPDPPPCAPRSVYSACSLSLFLLKIFIRRHVF